MTDDTQILQRNADTYTGFYIDAVGDISDRLRRLADTVDRECKALDRRDTPAAYATTTENILHEITWGVANLNAERLISKATRADDAVRQLSAATPDDDKAD